MAMSLVQLAAAWPHWRKVWKRSNITERCVPPSQFAIPSRFYLGVVVRRSHYVWSHNMRISQILLVTHPRLPIKCRFSTIGVPKLDGIQMRLNVLFLSQEV